MRKYLTHLLTLAACFLCSMSVNAQFSKTVEMYQGTSWSDCYQDVEFDLAAVAEALGTDAATLVADLNAWMENDAPEVFLFQKSDFVPTALSDYTADNRGFWMKLDGTVVSYGQKETEDGPELQEFYAFFWWNADEGKLFVRLGQMPNKLEVGAEGNVKLVIAYNDKQATFDMTLKIIEKVKPDIPDPVTDLTALNIVGTKNIDWAQYPNMPMNQVVDITGVAEALGTTDEVLAENLSEFLFMTTLELKGEDESSQKPYKTTTLSNASTAGGIGFWMATVWDDELEAFTEEAVRCVWGDHAAFRVMYSEQYSFDAATHELSSVTGWESYTLELGSKYNFDLYIVCGDKGYKLHHVITLTKKPEEDPNKWVKVSEEEQTVSMMQGDNMTSLNLDLDAIAAALDCEASALKVYGPSDKQGNIDDRHTANNGGFWFSGNGVVCSWNASDDEGSPFTFYIEPVANQDFTAWNVGQNSRATEGGTTYTTTLFFFNGNKSDTNNHYYAVNVNIVIENKPDVDVEFTSVAEKTLAYRVEPQASSYGGDIVPGVDLDEMEELIGTRSATLYGWVKTDDGVDYSDAYSCTPYPGFWLDPDGYVSTWQNATASPFAYSYLADGTFQLFQFPGGNAQGTVRKTTCFLVNLNDGRMITINMSIAFGDVINYEEVGSKDITLIADPDPEHQTINVDFADAVEALGVADVTAMLSGQCVAAITSDGTWSDPQKPDEGVMINDNGFFDTSAPAFSIYMTPGEGTFVDMLADNETASEIPDDFQLKAKLAIQRDVDGTLKQYNLNVTIVSLAIYTGINDVKDKNNATVIYDLSGRRSDATRHGVYIRNGKKLVK